MARIHWVSLVTPGALPWAELKELIRASYDHALSKLTKKARTELLSSEHQSS
jgi:predicted DNA-binding protein (MmcQ/YjbR family)